MSFVTIRESDSLCYYDTNSLGGSLPTNVTIDLCGSFKWVVTITQHESLSQLLQTNYMDLSANCYKRITWISLPHCYYPITWILEY